MRNPAPTRPFTLFLPDTGAMFLHIPRTGGTWVKSLFAKGYLEIPAEFWFDYRTNVKFTRKHTLLAYFRPEFLERVKYVFAFVRNPVDLYRSLWAFTRYQQEKRPNVVECPPVGSLMYNQWLRLEYPGCWSTDFDEWANKMLEERPGFVTRMYEQYVGPEYGEFCHFIGRTKTLRDDIILLLRKLGYEFDEETVPRNIVNRSMSGYNPVVSDEL